MFPHLFYMMFLLFPLHLLPVLFRTQTKLILKCFGKCERILIANLLRHFLHRKPPSSEEAGSPAPYGN